MILQTFLFLLIIVGVVQGPCPVVSVKQDFPYPNRVFDNYLGKNTRLGRGVDLLKSSILCLNPPCQETGLLAPVIEMHYYTTTVNSCQTINPKFATPIADVQASCQTYNSLTEIYNQYYITCLKELYNAQKTVSSLGVTLNFSDQQFQIGMTSQNSINTQTYLQTVLDNSQFVSVELYSMVFSTISISSVDALDFCNYDLTCSFKEDVNNLPASQNDAAYDAFLAQYGHAFIVDLQLGGNILQVTQVTTPPTPVFVPETSSNFFKNNPTTITLQGGTPPADLTQNTAYTDWLQTIKDNPIPVSNGMILITNVFNENYFGAEDTSSISVQKNLLLQRINAVIPNIPSTDILTGSINTCQIIP